jgi:teichuronic acid biosynthesis glycosyltransferase TuaC
MEGKGRWDGYAEDYKEGNVEVYFCKPWAFPLEFSRRRRGDDSFKAAKDLLEKNEIKFDLIHAHFTYPAGYVGARIKETYAKPMVLTVHEDREWFLREVASEDTKINYAWRTADRIIRVNMADLKVLEKAGISRKRLVYIPNGFSSRLFKPVDKYIARKKLGLSQDKKILLNLAALGKYKGQEYLIRAMKILVAERKDILLCIVGMGPLEKYIQSLIENLGLRDNVVLSGGNKKTEEIPFWINACDVFVLPSLSEGNPTVMFEALGCSKPFVGTSVGGIPEIIVNENLGILVEPKEVEGLARAIDRALNIEWDAGYISNYARQFSWDRICQRIIEEYHAVLIENSAEGK